MTSRRFASLPILALAAALLHGSPGLAKAPAPLKPVALERLMGRWHEIVRTPNRFETSCIAGVQDWSAKGDGKLSVVQTCHRDSVAGPERRMAMTIRVVDPGANTRFEASMLGGLIKEQYLVVDHADDYAWMIGCTSGGNYVTLFARSATLSAAELATLTAHMAAMGFDISRLVSALEPPD